MRTIIHDLNEFEISKLKFNEDDKIISSLECSKNCIGCFSCWIRHPKKCVLKDEYNNISEYLKYSSELIIISKSRYGCYSSNTKRVLERCIGYVLPYFTIRNNEIHHESRYDKKLKFRTYFYGDISDEDKKSLEKLVKANCINLNGSSYEINYINDIKEINECIHL